MIPYFSDVIFNTRRLALKEATTLQDTTTLTQRKSSEYSLPSEISSLLILVCFLRKSIEYAIKRLYHIVYCFWFILLYLKRRLNYLT